MTKTSVEAGSGSKKTILITGCSTGFGRALVSVFLARGWNVVATLRGAEARRHLFESELKQFSSQLFLVSLDVTEALPRENLVRFIQERFSGRLDVLVNNAGYGAAGAVEDLSEVQIRYQMEVNFYGPLLLTRALLPALRAARGRVIHISSVLGFSSLPLHAMYCASKYALEGLAEAMDHELRMVGVQTALVEPGSFRTEFLENRIWGERSKAGDSPYYGLTSKVEEFLDTRPNSIYGKPDAVVKRVLGLVSSDLMPFRTPVGKDAILVCMLKRLLSRNLYVTLIRSVFRRTFFGGEA